MRRAPCVTVPSRQARSVLPAAEATGIVATMVPSAAPRTPTDRSAPGGAACKRVLVATDGSASTTEAIGAGLRLLGPGVDVEVVGVAGMGDALLAAIPGPGLLPPRGSRPIGGTARRSREAVERAASALGGRAETRVLEWPPGPAICQRAAEDGVDAVVIVQPGDPGPIDRLRRTALTRYVVEHAPCPVLVVR